MALTPVVGDDAAQTADVVRANKLLVVVGFAAGVVVAVVAVVARVCCCCCCVCSLDVNAVVVAVALAFFCLLLLLLLFAATFVLLMVAGMLTTRSINGFAVAIDFCCFDFHKACSVQFQSKGVGVVVVAADVPEALVALLLVLDSPRGIPVFNRAVSSKTLS